jgi:enoyl-CoA hydratase/carnithine racemase
MELAMMCDIIYSSRKAKFGQPEIKLGTIPGGGGTQRLTKIVGKYKSMEMILTGDMIDAEEAKRLGIVCDIYNEEDLIQKVLEKTKIISSYPLISLKLAKKAIKASFNTGLDQGLEYERNLFHSTFALVFSL